MPINALPKHTHMRNPVPRRNPLPITITSNQRNLMRMRNPLRSLLRKTAFPPQERVQPAAHTKPQPQPVQRAALVQPAAQGSKVPESPIEPAPHRRYTTDHGQPILPSSRPVRVHPHYHGLTGRRARLAQVPSPQSLRAFVPQCLSACFPSLFQRTSYDHRIPLERPQL